MKEFIEEKEKKMIKINDNENEIERPLKFESFNISIEDKEDENKTLEKKLNWKFYALIIAIITILFLLLYILV